MPEGKNNLGLKLDSKTSKSDKNGKYDSKPIELFVLTATGGIADLQVEGEQVNRLHTREIPHPLVFFIPICGQIIFHLRAVAYFG